MVDDKLTIRINMLVFPELKRCPWCGSAGNYDIQSLEKANGRGYPGCHLVRVICDNPECRATAPNGESDDIYRSLQDAITISAEVWNKRDKKKEKRNGH